MAQAPDSDGGLHQVYRSSSIYPDLSTVDLGLQFDFDFGFDLDTEKAMTTYSMSSQEHDIPSHGSETALKTPRGSVGAKSEKSLGEQYIVFWDGPYDPANPQNWSQWRKWTAVMIVSGITFVTLAMLTGFRFLAGCAGSAALTIGGGTIADVMPPEKRGKALSLFVLGPVAGPSLGPVAGGFLAQAAGWRWIFWLLTIVSGLMTILTFLFLRETYAPKLLRDKAKKLKEETGQERYKSKLEMDLPARTLFLRAIVRPSKMLLFSPIVLGLSCFMALVYAYIYLLFTTFPLVFEAQYNFSTGTVGLAYLGMGIGMVTAALVVGYTSDRQVEKMAAKSGERKPEYRLPIMMLGGPLIAAGLFWYGWSAEEKTHW
ncbi:MAG: hypothetical protein Q9222_004142 [Ikaeria aurantiellina]